MLRYLTKVLLLIGAILALVSCGSETQKSDIHPQIPSPASPSGPIAGLSAEPRQSVNPIQTGPVYPYNLYQNSVYANNPGPQTPSSSGSSVLSFLRTGQGGRRSSLTSKLKSLMNAIFFRRETSSPYMPSGSSYSFSFRQPPYGFSSGYGSSYSSGLGSSSPNFLSAASGYRPVVLPNYSGNVPNGNSWSNYKQWTTNEAGGQDTYSSSFASQMGNGPSQYAWSSNTGSSGPISGLTSALNSYSGNSGTNPAFQNSNAVYQAAASNSYPSASYSSSSYQSPDISYKRSSSTNFKPVVRSSYSSGPVASASSSVSSSVSSSSSSYDPNESNNPSSANYKQ